MSDDGEPRRVLIGVFGEGIPNLLVIPKGALAPAERILDAERLKREAEATRAAAQVLRNARNRGKFAKALKTILRQGPKP